MIVVVIVLAVLAVGLSVWGYTVHTRAGRLALDLEAARADIGRLETAVADSAQDAEQTRERLREVEAAEAEAEARARRAEQTVHEAEARQREAEAAIAAADEARARAEAIQREAEAAIERSQLDTDAAEERVRLANEAAMAAEGEIQEVIEGSAAGRASLRALWALELMREERSWRLAGGDMGRPPRPVRKDPGAELEVALSMTLDRLREEVGTPSNLKAELTERVSSDVALCSLRICQELVAVAARHCDGIDVNMRTDEGDLLCTVIAESWDGEMDLPGAPVFEATARRLGGSFTETSTDENLIGVLRIPVDATAATRSG